MKNLLKLCGVIVSALLLLSCFGGCGKKQKEEKPDASTILDSDTNDKVDGIVADDTVVDDNSVEVDFETGETKPAPSKKTTKSGQTTTTQAAKPTADTTTGSQSTATTVTETGNTTTAATGTTTTAAKDTMGNTGEWSPWQG